MVSEQDTVKGVKVHDVVNAIHAQRLKTYSNDVIINHLSVKFNIRRSDISEIMWEMGCNNETNRRARAEWLKRKQ